MSELILSLTFQACRQVKNLIQHSCYSGTECNSRGISGIYHSFSCVLCSYTHELLAQLTIHEKGIEFSVSRWYAKAENFIERVRCGALTIVTLLIHTQSLHLLLGVVLSLLARGSFVCFMVFESAFLAIHEITLKHTNSLLSTPLMSLLAHRAINI